MMKAGGIRPEGMTFGAHTVAVLLLLIGTAVACRHEPIEYKIVWPVPPDPPRIQYIQPIRASSDVEKTSKMDVFVNILLGGQKSAYIIKKPYGVHLDPSGRLLVADTGWGKVLVFDIPNGEFSFMGEGPLGQLSKPAGIATDKDGTIYVSDLLLHRVYVYNKNGSFLRALGGQDRFKQPVGIAVDRERRKVFVVDMKNHQVVIFDTAGQEIAAIGKRGSGNGEFNYPSNVAVAKSGDIYVVDSFNFRVQHFDTNGQYLGQWGKPGDLPGMFSRPKGVAIDRDGHVYVVDAAFHNVQIFTPDGELLMAFGDIGHKMGQFFLPAGIDITPDGRIFVADQLNRRVDMLAYLGGGAAAPEEDETAVVKEDDDASEEDETAASESP